MKSSWLSRSLVGLVLGVIACTTYLAYGITEEVPIGSMTGTAVMAENGNPLPKAYVILTPQMDTANFTDTRMIRTDKDGNFRFRNLPAGNYTLEASGKAHSIETFKVEVKEGQASVQPLKLEPKAPYLDLYSSQKVFVPGEKMSIELSGFGTGDAMAFKVYKIDSAKLIAKGGQQKLYSAFGRAKTDGGIDPASIASDTKNFDHIIKTRDLEGVFMERPELPPLTEGFYWVQATIQVPPGPPSPGKTVPVPMPDITKGTYINVSKIGLVTKSSGTQLLTYVADLKTGAPVSGSKIEFYREGQPKVEGVSAADGTATLSIPAAPAKTGDEEDADSIPGSDVTVATLGDSTAVVDFGMTRQPPDSQNRIFMYTDRPIYRPGDEVHFKGIIRTLKGSEYSLPGGGMAQIEIHDAGDNLVERQTAKVDARGQFNGSFTTNKETDPGEYSVKVKALGAAETLGVSLADYRKPEYDIKITPANTNGYTVGDKVKAVISCQYYYGGPVIGAKVTANVSKSPAYDFMDEEYGEEYGSGSGQDSESFELVTDEQGKATIEFDTSPKSDEDTPNDWIYTVNATVSEGEKYFEGSGDIRVNQGAYALEVRDETGFSEPGQPVAVSVFTRKHGEKTPVAGRHVKLTVGTQEWNDAVEEFHPEQTLDALTDANGGATVSFTPRSDGMYLIKGESSDENGHSVEAQDSLFVEGGRYYVGGKEQAFDVTLDKRKYKVGETAKALIRTSKPGCSALVTVEADKVLWSKVVKLGSVSTEISIPVSLEDSPNAFVSVTAMQEKTYLEATARLVIDDERRPLNIKITPDRENHKPGEKASYTVHTSDPSGKPVSADVSLVVVDESIYAIREDSTDPLAAFYPKRENSVATAYSFPELYLDGGDKGGHVPIRKKFRDTAYWNPDIRTDAGGNAQVTVTLPDNLTQWRTTCVGVSDDTRVGTGKCGIRASKPLMLRIETPMFVTSGDKLTFSAIIQNDTGKDADVHLRLESTGIDVIGEKTQTVHVASDRGHTVEWTLDAKQAGDAKLTARAWIDGGESDGVEQVLPVNPAGLILQERRAEVAKGYGKLTVRVDPAADRTFGRLIVNVSPTIAQAMFQSLDELIGYPYGCTEQTMSRFLPAILVQKALKGAPSPRPDLTKQIPQIAAESLTRLKKMQHSDGGWGWWIYDTSDPFMTAYVLDGLHRAKAAGYSINQFMIDNAVKWAGKALDAPLRVFEPRESKEWVDYEKASERRQRLYLGFALAENGDAAGARKALKFYDPAKADALETSYAVLLLHALGSPDLGPVLAHLKGMAKMEGDAASWSVGRHFWASTEPTSLALTALAEHDPHDPMVQMAARYLMRSRQGDWWYTTRDTAFALVGLCDYMASTGELANPQSVSVIINGKTVKTLSFGAASSTAPETRIEIPMSQLKQGENVVEVRNAGGVTYFGTDLKQAVAPDGARLVGNDSGLKIDRVFYKMESRKLENGLQRLMPSLAPVTQVKSGDILECHVTLNADRAREFVMIEVPTPANTRVTDSDSAFADVDWSNWWSQTVIRDDRVSFFMRDLPAGKSELSFIVRAEADGTATAGPATGANMYDPAQSSHSAMLPLEVAKP